MSIVFTLESIIATAKRAALVFALGESDGQAQLDWVWPWLRDQVGPGGRRVRTGFTSDHLSPGFRVQNEYAALLTSQSSHQISFKRYEAH